MILTCPQCTTRYLLPAAVLAPDGRNVKCSSCDEIWHQEPDADELAGGEPATLPDDGAVDDGNFIDFVDIPEGVRPDLDEASEDGASEGGEAESFSLGDFDIKALAGGGVAAFLVFFVIFMALVFVKNPLVSAWPASAALYELFGMSVNVPGEGLVFDRLKAQSEGAAGPEEDIMISGQIINLIDRDQALPTIEASLRSKSGEVLEQWIVDMPENMVPAEASMRFMQSHKTTHKNAHELFMRFVLNGAQSSENDAKTVLEDADNTDAQHPDDHAPPHGDEAAPESHAPVSAPHH